MTNGRRFTLKAAIYARLSQAKSREQSDSIKNQISALTKLAENRGYEIVGIYTDDGISAFKRIERPGFTSMLIDMSRGKFDLILARHSDRLERNDEDGAKLRVACVRYGVTWQTADGMITDPATASGGFLAKMLSAVGQLESDLKSERLLMHYSALTMSGNMQAPKGTFGYDDTDRSKVVPVEAALIKAAYLAVATEGRTVGSVVREWNDKAVPHRKGGKRWTYAHLNSILRRPRNAGFIADRAGNLIERDEGGNEIFGKWETIIDVETWRTVQAILDTPGRKTSPGFQPVYLSSGIARCAVCGSAMRSNTATDKRRGTRLQILRCSSARKGERHASGRLDVLEPKVRQAVLMAFAFGPANLFPDTPGVDIAALQKALDDVLEAQTRVLDHEDQGRISHAVAVMRLNKLRVQETEAREAIEKARASSSTAHMLVDLRRGMFDGTTASFDGTAALVEELGRRFDSLHIEQRRRLVQQLVEITITPGRAHKFHLTQRVVTSLDDDDVFAELEGAA
jgi:site-specific DNA recombinase